jgi:hypothetical protein
MQCGDCVLMPTRGRNAIPHLWIIVTEPDGNGECVIVNVTTLRNSADQTVILGSTDHSFITHASAVRYADAEIFQLAQLEAMISAGVVDQMDACNADLLRLVQQGLLASPFTPQRIINHCKTRWGR